MISLRPATAADQPGINAIIHQAQLNPMSLKWQNFVLAVDEASGEIVGTGQIKTHGDGSRELASIAVLSAYQRRGVAHQIITHLLAHSSGLLFLTCMSNMGTFYETFGFQTVARDQMTPYFKRITRITGVVAALMRYPERMLVMKREG